MMEDKDMNEKLEVLLMAIKHNDKRIAELERNCCGGMFGGMGKLGQYDELSEYKLQMINHIRNEK
jgi:hypothetical protein